MGGPWDKPSTDSESDKTRWLYKGNPEKMPHISDFTYQKCTTLSEPAHVTIYMLSFSLLPGTLFHYCPSACVNSFIQSQKSRALYWLLALEAWCLGFRAFYASAWLQSLSRKPKSFFKLLQAESPEIKMFITSYNEQLYILQKQQLLKITTSELVKMSSLTIKTLYILMKILLIFCPCSTFYFIQIWMNSKFSNFSHIV